jgi:hypothetical protein
MPDLLDGTTASAMSEYVVIVTDQLQSALAGHDGISYVSPPQRLEHALALARALVGLTSLPGEDGPWRQARPGGTRTVRIEPAP